MVLETLQASFIGTTEILSVSVLFFHMMKSYFYGFFEDAFEEGKYCLLKFTLESCVLRSDVVSWGGEKPPNVTSVVVLGVKKAVGKVVVNGANSSFNYNASISVSSIF